MYIYHSEVRIKYGHWLHLPTLAYCCSLHVHLASLFFSLSRVSATEAATRNQEGYN